MPIRESGYYAWEGEIVERKFRWTPIFVQGIIKVFRKKWAKLLFSFLIAPLIVFMAAIWFSTKPEAKMLGDLVKMIPSDARLFNVFYTNGYLNFFLIILCLFGGVDLVSGDLKYNSFSLYFSRPLKRWDYIWGKVSILVFYLLLFTLGPGIVLMLAKILFSGKLSISFSVFVAAVLYPVVISLFMGSLTVMLSSLTANRRLVYIFFISFYAVSEILGEEISRAANNDYFNLFSIEKNFEQLSAWLFRVKPVFDSPGWLSAMVLLGCCGLFLGVINLRLKRREN